jgi:hypothetical protein
MPPGIGSRAPGTLLQDNNFKLIADRRVSPVQFPRGTSGGLVEAEPGFNTYYEQVKDIGHRKPNFLLSGLDLSTEPKIWTKISQSQGRDVNDYGALIGEPAKKSNGAKGNRADDLGAVEELDS